MVSSVYRGFSYPFQIGDAGTPQPASDMDLLMNSLEQIILTDQGERLMRPEFGSRVLDYIFENSSEGLGSALIAEVSGAIGRYEPRVLVTRVNVVRDDTTVYIDIDFQMRATGQVESMRMAIPAPSA